MSPEFCRRFAEQCRELLALARTEAAKEQLLLWINEFEAQAEATRWEFEEKQQQTERDA